MSIASTAYADTGYKTGFERSKFLGGEQLLGVDGWSVAIPAFLNAPAAKITGDASRSGLQSISVWGEDLIGSEGITFPYDAVGSYRKPLNLTINPAKPKVLIEADLLLSTSRPPTDDEFFGLTIGAVSSDGGLGEVGLISNGLVEGYASGALPGAVPAQTKPASLNRWHHIAMLLDFAGRTIEYFIDGQSLGAALPMISASNVLSRGSMVVYALPDVGDTSVRSNYTARFDNFSVSVNGN